MKICAFLNKFVLISGLVLASQGFAVEKWTDEAVQPGQDGGYYIINNEQELAWIALKTMNKETNYKVKLNADLDLKGKLWLPISAGHGGNGFKGEFNGQGHTVKNVYIKSDELLSAYNDKCLAQNLGFFGINGGGSIIDLNLENVDIYATNSHIDGCGNEISVGGLVGWKTASASTIKNIVVSGKIYTSGKAQGVGGLVGNAHSNSISNSVSMVNITADGDSAFVGGIVGLVKNNEVKIDSCVYAGEKLESNGNGGAVGAVSGRVYKGNANANMNQVYYDVDLFGEEPVGVVGPQGQGGKTSGEASPVSDLNNEEVICMLNKGTLDANGECDKQEPWSVGGQNISWNGSDGFKVTFDADGGTFPENSKTYKMLSSGNAITADEIASPTKDGVAFAGWSLTQGASEPSELGVATKPTRVYAVWNPIYTITFNANGGSFPPDETTTKQKNVAKGDVITVEGIGALPESYCKVPSELGCDVTMYFKGWSFEQAPSEGDIVDLNELNLYASKDTTLYAAWTSVETYTVTFNAGGHGKTKVDFVRVGAGESITQPVDPSADEGYEFDGWFTDSGTEFDFSTLIGASIILYAHWSPADYAITYMLDGGENNPGNPLTYNVQTPTFEFGAPSRDGYTFEKWYYDDGFSSPATQITQGTTGAKTLYAKWIPNVYTITYRAGSVGQGTVLPSQKEHGTPINLKLINNGFSRNGFTQTGWSTTENNEIEYASGALYEENQDLTLYPTWDIVTYSITYVCEVCTESNPSKPRTYTINDTKDGNLSIYNPTFSSNEYEFKGWYWDENYTKRTTNIPKGAFGDTTLYGKMLKKYTISYELNGGTKANSRTSYTSETATFALGEATGRNGYVFGGWYTNAEFEGDAVTEIPLGSTGDMTLYAKWIPEIETVQYGAVKIYTYASDGHKEAVIDATSKEDIPTITDVTVSAVTFNRDFAVGAKSTIVLPFSISVSKVHGGTFYEFARMYKENGKWAVGISVLENNATLNANTPYIVIANTSNLTFDVSAESPVTLNTSTMNYVSIDAYETVSSATPIEENAWTFKGTYQYWVFGEMDEFGRAYGFSAEAKDGVSIGAFVRGGAGATIRPLRAYLVYEGGQSSSKTASLNYNSAFTELPDEVDVVVLDEQNNVTERGVMNTVTGQIRMDRWYDLQGRKLNSEPKTQGTYYHNGKRVIVK